MRIKHLTPTHPASRLPQHGTPTASPAPQKPTTRAQRVSNSVWLRSQISVLVRNCDESIAEDQGLADLAHDEKRAMYLSRVESHWYWKRQLERILRGTTAEEDLAKDLEQWGIRP